MDKTTKQKQRYALKSLGECQRILKSREHSHNAILAKLNTAINYCARFAHYDTSIANVELMLCKLKNDFVAFEDSMAQFKADEFHQRLRREKALKDQELPNSFDRLNFGRPYNAA